MEGLILYFSGTVVNMCFHFQMMADLMFRKGEYDSATFHFQQLLQRKPGD